MENNKPQEGIDLVQGLTNTQKWLLFVGVTALTWYITYKIEKQKL